MAAKDVVVFECRRNMGSFLGLLCVSEEMEGKGGSEVEEVTPEIAWDTRKEKKQDDEMKKKMEREVNIVKKSESCTK